MRNLLLRIRAFLRPVSGWKIRLNQFRAGQTVWYFDDLRLPPTMPWPPAWFPHIIVRNDKDQLEVRFLNTLSLISDRRCEGEEAVCCARCGIDLHISEANMENNVSPPLCPWCASVA